MLSYGPSLPYPLLKALTGENNPISNVVLVTTKGDMVDESRRRSIENTLVKEDAFWGSMIRRGSRLIRHTGDKESAMGIIDYILRLPHKIVSDNQDETGGQGVPIHEMGAGKELDTALKRERERLERRMEEREKEFKQVQRNHDQAMAEELRKAQDQYSAQTSPSTNAIEDRSVYIERLKEQIEKAYKERIQQLKA
jgi:hypothetical protein